MDVADQGPGPRDPEIPHHTGTTKPGWARNLTTVAVVPPRPRAAGDDAEGRGGPADSDAETRAGEVADRPDESDATRAAETDEAPAADTADTADTADEQPAAQESDGAEGPGASEARDGEAAGAAAESVEPAEEFAAMATAADGAGDSDTGADEAHDGEGAGLATSSDADPAAEPAEAAPAAESSAPAEDSPVEASSDREGVGVAAESAEPGELSAAAASGADAAEGSNAAVEPAKASLLAASDAAGRPPADDPDTALLAPVSAAPAADPDTALLRPVGKGKAEADGEEDELDAWVASLGNRPAELEAKPDESGEGGDGDETAKAEESSEPSGKRRRLVNPWMAAAGVAALLLAGAAVVQNPFTMATAQRVPQSDVPRMSDPEPPKDSAPVDGGSARDLELPPVLPAAAPGSAGSPQPSGVIGTISASPTRTSAPPPAAPVNAGSNGIPQIVLAAYQQAAATTAKADPACKLPWQLLAGIGRVESSHANNGQVTANGTAVTPILGPRLDGSHSTAVIRDTDKGVYDLDPEFDRAVGPMQFIPSTWKSYGMDGNKDGKSDPENVYDASLAAARYLCAGDRDLSRPADLDRAIYSYNKSTEYVSTVKAWMQFYGNGVRAVPATTTPPATKATTKTGTATTKSSG
ncbi:lytic transglycosylase domain-containing protein [Uniformispora flossi]|uniref:lytic transglycosylase domain-containing protein n=1 Tax=Uniformispora flossi TaxID=3390723 RepID=UPI003C2C0F30